MHLCVSYSVNKQRFCPPKTSVKRSVVIKTQYTCISCWSCCCRSRVLRRSLHNGRKKVMSVHPWLKNRRLNRWTDFRHSRYGETFTKSRREIPSFSHVLFIYCLFNDAFSSWTIYRSEWMMIGEWWFGKKWSWPDRCTIIIYFNCKWVLPGGSGYTIRHNKQITHITQNNTTIKRNTTHKATHTIKYTLHRQGHTTLSRLLPGGTEENDWKPE
jgi:hypothetical protein